MGRKRSFCMALMPQEKQQKIAADILVVAYTKERFFERMATVLEIVRDLYNGLALSPIVLRPEEVSERLKIGDQFVQEIIETGVEL